MYNSYINPMTEHWHDKQLCTSQSSQCSLKSQSTPNCLIVVTHCFFPYQHHNQFLDIARHIQSEHNFRLHDGRPHFDPYSDRHCYTWNPRIQHHRLQRKMGIIGGQQRRSYSKVNSPHHTEGTGTYLRYSLFAFLVGTGAMLNIEFPTLEKGSN